MAVRSGRTSLASKTKTLQVGDTAPDFTLPEHRSREPWTLSDFRGRKHIVLAFYPLDWTSV